jgi:type VI secretion system secreted protein VgrG
MQAPTLPRLAVAEFELVCNDGPCVDWAVVTLHVEEAINARYVAVVELECAVEDTPVADFLGCSCELVFLREAESRRVYGVVTRAEHLGSSLGHERVRLTLVPALSLLDAGSNSRIFQDMSVQDIIRAVLVPALASCERTLELGDLGHGAAVRDYCVQYREPDGGFATRLLEEAGISYVFEHRDGSGAETLVLRDANPQYPEYEGLDGSNEVPVIPERAEQAELESIQELDTHGALTLTKVVVRDFDWQLPRELLTHETGDADARGHTRRRYVHGARRFIADDQAERAEDQLEAEAVEALVLRGRSNVTAFAPGLRFFLTHPATPELDGEYLLTRVVHRANAGTAGSAGEHYANEFECVPVAAPLRPRHAMPRPRVHGPQTATVVGDEEIHTDEHGRVQVQFHWQEEPSYASGASCWVRCAQSWAGSGWGAQFIPRVGMEVVVEFLDGDPDRPLVTGCVYNGDNAVPFVLPDDKTQSGWRTSSSPGGEGYNMLRFEDAAGNEEIHIHGQKDWTIVIENDKVEEIRHDETLEVGNDRQTHVGNDEREIVDHDRTLTVANNHHETVGAAKTVNVGAAYALSVGGAAAVTIAGASVETVGESKTVLVSGGCSETITGEKALVAKSLSEDVETNKTTSVGEKLRMTAGKDFGLEAKKKGLIDAGDKLVLSCGKASITLTKNGDIQIEGNKIAVKGKGDVKIKGKKVANN